MTVACPCGSGRSRAGCCGPYLDEVEQPPTAESLMRARYSAYTEVNTAFLSRTIARKGRDRDPNATRSQMRRTQWLGLEILETTGGGVDDDEGTVTFEARYRLSGQGMEGFRERSRFRRLDGQWRYVDGDLTPLSSGPVETSKAGKKIGRNTPCPCGSGKKYKRCCGR